MIKSSRADKPVTTSGAYTTRNQIPFLLLCLIGFSTFFSSYLRIPVLPLFAATLGAGPKQIGLINGAFMLTAGLCSIPAGLLTDRTGCKLPIIVGIVATAVSSLLITQCHLPGQMAAAYILFGVGLAAFAPGMMSLVADVVPSHKLGLAYGWYTTAVYIAMTMGPAAGGFLAKVLGLREVFFVSGGLLLMATLLALLVLPQGSPRHKTDLHIMLAASRQLLHNRRLLACLSATIGSCIGYGVYLTFMPLFAASQGHDPAQVGLVFSAQAMTNVVGRIPIGKLADRVDRSKLITAGLISIAVALAAFGQAAQVSAMVVCSIILGIGMALNFTAIGAVIAEQIPVAQRGLAMGIYNSCIYLGMMAGSTAMGLALKRIGYPTGFAIAGSITIIALIIFNRIPCDKQP